MRESEVKKTMKVISERDGLLRLSDTLEKGDGRDYVLMLDSCYVGRLVSSPRIISALRAAADKITDELRAAGIEGE